jgi:hypothetical protein
MTEDISIGNNFLNRSPIAQEIRARTVKWDCIKEKGFCTSKETTTSLKTQPTEWGKTFGSYIHHTKD